MGSFFSTLLSICGIKPQKEEENIEYTIEDTNSDTSNETISSEDLKEELLLQEIAIEEMNEEIALVEEKNTIYTVSGEKHALIIGINYNEDQMKEDDLQGCVNDMNNIKEVLQGRCCFMEEDITTLKNSEATRENIEEELLNLVIFSHILTGGLLQTSEDVFLSCLSRKVLW